MRTHLQAYSVTLLFTSSQHCLVYHLHTLLITSHDVADTAHMQLAWFVAGTHSQFITSV